MIIITYWWITIILKYTYSPLFAWSKGLWSSTTFPDSLSGVIESYIGEGWFIVGSVEKVLGFDSPTWCLISCSWSVGSGGSS